MRRTLVPHQPFKWNFVKVSLQCRGGNLLSRKSIKNTLLLPPPGSLLHLLPLLPFSIFVLNELWNTHHWNICRSRAAGRAAVGFSSGFRIFSPLLPRRLFTLIAALHPRGQICDARSSSLRMKISESIFWKNELGLHARSAQQRGWDGAPLPSPLTASAGGGVTP